MNLYEILGIIIIHWIADFVLQTDEMAQRKSKEWEWLLLHTITYSMVWIVLGIILSKQLGIADETYIYTLKPLNFVLITFITHTITDYFTSRLNAKLWKKGDTHNFFVSVGFDQILHYAQLFFTYQLLFK